MKKEFLFSIMFLFLLFMSCYRDTECMCERITADEIETEIVDPVEMGVERCSELNFAQFGTSYKCD